MTKAEFIEKYRETIGGEKTKAQAAREVDTFLDLIQDTVASGEDIVIPGVFTIKHTFKEAHEATNPQKPKEKITVPARHGAKLKVGSKWAKKLNNIADDTK